MMKTSFKTYRMVDYKNSVNVFLHVYRKKTLDCSVKLNKLNVTYVCKKFLPSS